MAQSVADKLDEARALIEKGWTRGKFKRGQCYCSLGAIAVVTTGSYQADDWGFPSNDEYLAAIGFLSEAIGKRTSPYIIARWNDEQRSKKAVVAALSRAAELARGVQA